MREKKFWYASRFVLKNRILERYIYGKCSSVSWDHGDLSNDIVLQELKLISLLQEVRKDILNKN